MARIFAIFTSAVAAGLASLSCLAVAAASVEEPKVLVMVYNRSHTPTGEVAEAQLVAQKALRQAGVESTWVNCLEANPPVRCSEKPGQGRLVLTLIPRWSGREADGASLGLALPVEDGIGTYCYIFVERLEALVESAHSRPSGLLGFAMAHEIGHLLKGSNSHSPDGIMAAWWYPVSIRFAEIGLLRFTEADGTTMQKRLLQYGHVR
jgi:hypothetical protein